MQSAVRERAGQGRPSVFQLPEVIEQLKDVPLPATAENATMKDLTPMV
jgi:hypothetical protein